MKRITPSLIATLCLFAAPLLAEVSPQPTLEYAQYTLSTQSFTTLDTAPADGVEAWALNTKDTILFVRDTTKTDASYYIAVFELTRVQAKALGWTTEDEPSMIAFGDVNSSKALPAPLFYPTPDQWKAYVEEKPITRPCNLSYGRSVASAAVLSLESWMTDYLANGDSAKNAYGLYDTFGNVAECTIDAEGNLTFQGWYAETTTSFADITRDNAETTLAAIQANKGKIDNAVAGVRPIYIPPENQTYTVTVTLDGRTLEPFPLTGLEPDEPITVNNLPPTPNEGYRLNPGPVVSPADLAIEFNEGSATFTMPMDHVTLAYTSSAQATLTVNGGTADKEMVCPQEPFTLTADPTRTFLKWDGPGITDENATQNPLTLTLDKADVPAGGTLTYTAVFDPAITIKVIGGTAVPSTALKGETVTITATQNAWQTFSHWEDGHGITSNNAKTNPLTITLGENLADGAQLTYTAVFNSRPRVLVFGGTATSADDHGNGYYETGATLTLIPYDDCPEGYIFSHWQTANGDKLTEETYTVGQNNTTETLTAVYKADDTIANADPIYIGVVSETDDDKKARTGFGYLADEPKAFSYENKKNPIHYYGTTEPTPDYAQLVFDPKAIDYTTFTDETANTEANRKTALIMKRIKPENGAPYYVGIHEVTHAQYLGIHSATGTKYTLLHGTLPNNSIEEAKESLLPHATTGQSRYEADTFLTLLGTHYGETFSKPTQAQIAGIIAKYGDKKITAAMVNSNEDNQGLQNSGSQKVAPDPYGFYDLFGNAAEDLKDGNEWLWCGYYSTPLTSCTLTKTIESNFGAFPNGAIRPAIEVKPRHTVKLLNLPEENQSLQVLTGQTITLKPQVKPGCQFKGWQVNGEPYTTLETPLTITADTTLEATFSEALTTFDVTYGEGIMGPATAFPGTTIKVYTADPTVTLETLSVTPADAGKLNPDKTITFSDAISGPVTITLTSPEVKPGFHFYVR